MEAVVSLAMTEWRRPGLTDAVGAGRAGAGTEKVAEAARSPGARSRTRSSSVSGPRVGPAFTLGAFGLGPVGGMRGPLRRGFRPQTPDGLEMQVPVEGGGAGGGALIDGRAGRGRATAVGGGARGGGGGGRQRPGGRRQDHGRRRPGGPRPEPGRRRRGRAGGGGWAVGGRTAGCGAGPSAAERAEPGAPGGRAAGDGAGPSAAGVGRPAPRSSAAERAGPAAGRSGRRAEVQAHVRGLRRGGPGRGRRGRDARGTRGVIAAPGKRGLAATPGG